MQKLSEIIKEMAGTVLIDPNASSSEAVHVALLLSHVAWNSTIGVNIPETQYAKMLKRFEVSNPDVWKELKTKNYKRLIKRLIYYKSGHYREDKREITSCGTRRQNVHVEWVDPKVP